MPVWGITAIRTAPNSDRITRVRWQQIDSAENEWIGDQSVAEAHEVANELAVGNLVYSIHTLPDGNTVHGAQARHVVYQGGDEALDSLEPENHHGRTLHDLLHF